MGKLVIFIGLALVSTAWAYSGGAPENTCDDMTPKHPVDPQKSALPYKVTVDKSEIKSGGEAVITVSGKPFKGFLLQVRDADHKAVGQFQIPAGDRYSKATNCHGNQGSSATHKNAVDKQNLKLVWKAPAAGKYTVYATVAENGGVFWVRKPTASITVN